MLKSIVFKKNYRCFKKGLEVSFKKGINLICGEQGTGKSTLIDILFHTNENEKIINFYTDIDNELIKIYKHDFEKDNPRNKHKIESMYDIAIIFHSHGEVNLKIFETLKNKLNEDKYLFLIDEPETALSPCSCLKIVNLLKDLESSGHQIICVTHSPIIMLSFNILYSMNENNWIEPKKYLKNQLGEFYNIFIKD